MEYIRNGRQLLVSRKRDECERISWAEDILDLTKFIEVLFELERSCFWVKSFDDQATKCEVLNPRLRLDHFLTHPLSLKINKLNYK